MILITDAMDFEKALLWSNGMQVGSIYQIYKNTSWDLFTPCRDDAYIMAVALNSGAEPILDTPHQTGYCSHFHMSDRIFNGGFKSFHVWYSF